MLRVASRSLLRRVPQTTTSWRYAAVRTMSSNVQEHISALDNAAAKLDWSKLAGELKSPEARMELEFLRRQFDEVKKSLDILREPEPTIDWAFWKGQISNAALVDELKAAYTSAQLPSVTAAIESDPEKQFASLLSSAEEFARNSASRVAEVEKAVQDLNNAKDLDDVTVDEMLAAYPKAAAEVQKEVEANRWAL